MLTPHGSPYPLGEEGIGCAGGEMAGKEHWGWNVKWNKMNKYITIRYIMFNELLGFARIHPLFISYSLLHTHAHTLKNYRDL